MLPRVQSNNSWRQQWTSAVYRSYRPGRQGFTLVELLLVVALLMLLVGAMIFNFSALLRGNQLQEGTTRLETLMRFARAQAANSGRKVQLVFSAESTNTPAATTGEVRATWEPDPLRQPGCFADLAEAQWHVQEINDMVQVESVKLLETKSATPVTDCPEDDVEDETGGSSTVKPMAPITFYPDGSSDSAEIIVAARSADEEQRMAVRLVGLTGSISHQLLSAVDVADTASDTSPIEPVNAARRESVIRDSSTPEGPSTSRSLSPGPVDSSSRAVPTAPRATVGETNSVERGL
jgi:Tfp pilus assembly protein FimT